MADDYVNQIFEKRKENILLDLQNNINNVCNQYSQMLEETVSGNLNIIEAMKNNEDLQTFFRQTAADLYHVAYAAAFESGAIPFVDKVNPEPVGGAYKLWQDFTANYEVFKSLWDEDPNNFIDLVKSTYLTPLVDFYNDFSKDIKTLWDLTLYILDWINKLSDKMQAANDFDPKEVNKILNKHRTLFYNAAYYMDYGAIDLYYGLSPKTWEDFFSELREYNNELNDFLEPYFISTKLTIGVMNIPGDFCKGGASASDIIGLLEAKTSSVSNLTQYTADATGLAEANFTLNDTLFGFQYFLYSMMDMLYKTITNQPGGKAFFYEFVEKYEAKLQNSYYETIADDFKSTLDNQIKIEETKTLPEDNEKHYFEPNEVPTSKVKILGYYDESNNFQTYVLEIIPAGKKVYLKQQDWDVLKGRTISYVYSSVAGLSKVFEYLDFIINAVAYATGDEQTKLDVASTNDFLAKWLEYSEKRKETFNQKGLSVFNTFEYRLQFMNELETLKKELNDSYYKENKYEKFDSVLLFYNDSVAFWEEWSARIEDLRVFSIPEIVDANSLSLEERVKILYNFLLEIPYVGFVVYVLGVSTTFYKEMMKQLRQVLTQFCKDLLNPRMYAFLVERAVPILTNFKLALETFVDFYEQMIKPIIDFLTNMVNMNLSTMEKKLRSFIDNFQKNALYRFGLGEYVDKLQNVLKLADCVVKNKDSELELLKKGYDALIGKKVEMAPTPFSNREEPDKVVTSNNKVLMSKKEIETRTHIKPLSITEKEMQFLFGTETEDDFLRQISEMKEINKKTTQKQKQYVPPVTVLSPEVYLNGDAEELLRKIEEIDNRTGNQASLILMQIAAEGLDNIPDEPIKDIPPEASEEEKQQIELENAKRELKKTIKNSPDAVDFFEFEEEDFDLAAYYKEQKEKTLEEQRQKMKTEIEKATLPTNKNEVKITAGTVIAAKLKKSEFKPKTNVIINNNNVPKNENTETNANDVLPLDPQEVNAMAGIKEKKQAEGLEFTEGTDEELTKTSLTNTTLIINNVSPSGYPSPSIDGATHQMEVHPAVAQLVNSSFNGLELTSGVAGQVLSEKNKVAAEIVKKTKAIKNNEVIDVLAAMNYFTK